VKPTVEIAQDFRCGFRERDKYRIAQLANDDCVRMVFADVNDNNWSICGGNLESGEWESFKKVCKPIFLHDAILFAATACVVLGSRRHMPQAFETMYISSLFELLSTSESFLVLETP
jgi:hypothetical protein